MDRNGARDFYVVLGVERDATLSAIRRAYRRLARKYHPDAAGATTVEAFREVQAAYETLADAERRRRYDEDLRREERPRAPSWSLLRGPAAGDLRRPFEPGTLSGEIVLSEREAAAGGVLPIDIPVESPCPSCDGTGGAMFDCDRCGGDGTVVRRVPIPLRVPPGVREGTVFQVALDDPAVVSILLTVHIRPR